MIREVNLHTLMVYHVYLGNKLSLHCPTTNICGSNKEGADKDSKEEKKKIAEDKGMKKKKDWDGLYALIGNLEDLLPCAGKILLWSGWFRPFRITNN